MLVDDSGSIDELIRFDAHSARTPAHGTFETCRRGAGNVCLPAKTGSNGSAVKTTRLTRLRHQRCHFAAAAIRT
jgi:hypothetical protein